MIPSCKGPLCRSRWWQGSWKQSPVVLWYRIFPSREVPRFQQRDEGGEVCVIFNEIVGLSSSLLQSSFATSRQVLKRSDTWLFWTPPPPPLFCHCAPLLPRRGSISFRPPLVTHSLLHPCLIWVDQEDIWCQWHRENVWWLIRQNMTITDLLCAIDVIYRVITLIFKNMAIYPYIWRIMHYSRYPQFLQKDYIYIH